MSNSLDDIFELPAREILQVIFEEAMKDEQITPEEQAILDSVEKDLKAYQEQLRKAGEDKMYTIEEIKQLEQALKAILLNALNQAQQDRKISKDEEALILALVQKVEDIIAEKLKLLSQQ